MLGKVIGAMTIIYYDHWGHLGDDVSLLPLRRSSHRCHNLFYTKQEPLDAWTHRAERGKLCWENSNMFTSLFLHDEIIRRQMVNRMNLCGTENGTQGFTLSGKMLNHWDTVQAQNLFRNFGEWPHILGNVRPITPIFPGMVG